MGVTPDVILTLIGRAWQRAALLGVCIQQVRTAGGGLRLQMCTDLQKGVWRSVVGTTAAVEPGDAAGAAICALHGQLEAVLSVQRHSAVIRAREGAEERAWRVFMLDVVDQGHREVCKWWYPIGDPRREWTDAVHGISSGSATADAVPKRASNDCNGPFCEAVDPGDDNDWDGSDKTLTMSSDDSALFCRRRKFLRQADYVLRMVRGRHPNPLVAPAMLPFRTLACAAMHPDAPDSDVWTILWTFGECGHARRFVADMVPKLCERHPGVKFIHVEDMRMTVVVVSEQPTRSFDFNASYYTALLVPVVRPAFNAKRVEVVVGGGSKNDTVAIAQAAILARCLYFPSATNPDQPTCDVQTKVVIRANPRETPAAVKAAHALNCRFEGRVDPVGDDNG